PVECGTREPEKSAEATLPSRACSARPPPAWVTPPATTTGAKSQRHIAELVQNLSAQRRRHTLTSSKPATAPPPQERSSVTKTSIHSPAAPRQAGPYSHAVRTESLVFLSGQGRPIRQQERSLRHSKTK